jgi:predicted RNA binding protein YcfA (HicA-like mRNA interferase family)
MTPIIQISGKKLVKILENQGFLFVSQKGSHIKLEKKIGGGRLIVIVPNHKLIKPGTLRNILRHVGLTEEELKKLM